MNLYLISKYRSLESSIERSSLKFALLTATPRAPVISVPS